jgi:hypothetical protein
LPIVDEGWPGDNWAAKGGMAMTKRAYAKPRLNRLGLLRLLTKFSF